MKKILIALIVLTSYSAIIETILVIGDPNASSNATFSFDVGFIKFDPQTDSSAPRFWTATNDATIGTMADSTKQYGLSMINQTPSFVEPNFQSIAIPMANSEAATIFELDGTQVKMSVEANPIWGNFFKFFDVITQKPIFVINGQLNNLYSVHNIERYVITTDKQNITELTRYNFGSGEEIGAILGFMDSIYTAYSTGTFGSGASNIALLERKQTTGSKNEIQPYISLLTSEPITINTSALIGGNGQPALASFGPAIKLHNIMRRVYFTTEVEAGLAGVGAAIAQIFISNANKTFSMLFGPVIQENILASATSFDTVISAASNNTIRITEATGMLTSTNLSYMVIARDNGTGPQQIYAVPLMTTGNYTGMIADYSSVTTTFGSLKPVFTNRYFTNVLTDANQISLSNPAVQNQICVGGYNNLPVNTGNIQELYTVGDSVYIVIANDYATGNAPGTYRSQAIFAEDGHIISWTPWTRVLGSDKQMAYSFVDYKSLTALYLAAITPSLTPEFKSIYQTTFTNTSNLSAFLNKAPGYSGIQGLFDFNQKTPGFNNEFSMMIATGFKKVTFAQTGTNNSGNCSALIITNNDVLEFEDDAIAEQTSIIAAEIAHDSNNNHYIFAAGASGVCVYTNDSTGISWNGTLTNITDLDNNQTWKKVGDFKFVKKLIWDTNYIYIMTSNTIYRIALNPDKFTKEPTIDLDVEVFFEATDISNNTYFLDLIIDNGYCLLGTTQGLYQISGNIEKIGIPGGLPAVSQLSVISPSTNLDPQRSFKALSNLYVLNNTFGTQQAKIYRFVIQNGALNLLPDTVVATPENLTKGKPGPFIIFDNYISSYFTDGSWNTAQSYFIGPNQPQNAEDTQNSRPALIAPFVLQVNSFVRSGISSSQVIMPLLTTQIKLPFIPFGSNIINMVRETTSGALIASGEFDQAYANA
jgi:hypothetical protein